MKKIWLPNCLLLLEMCVTCLTFLLMYANPCSAAVNLVLLLVVTLSSSYCKLFDKLLLSFVFTCLFTYLLLIMPYVLALQCCIFAPTFLCGICLFGSPLPAFTFLTYSFATSCVFFTILYIFLYIYKNPLRKTKE